MIIIPQIHNLYSRLPIFVWVLLSFFPFILPAYYVSQLSLFLPYGLFAVSLALIWGQLGLICFGQAVFFGLGAYSMTLVTKGMIPWAEHINNSYVGLLMGLIIPACFANILGRFLFYGRGLSGGHFAIVTLAIAIIAERLAVNWDYIGGFNGLTGIPGINLGLGQWDFPLADPSRFYFFILAVTLCIVLLLTKTLRSSYGSVLRAIRDSESRTKFFGYETGSYKLVMFTGSAAIAGLAGAIFVTKFGFVAPSLMGFALSTEVLIWVAVGGKNALLPAFLGAIAVRGIESVLAESLGYYWLLAMGVFFVATVIFLPNGVFGSVLGFNNVRTPHKNMKSLRWIRGRRHWFSVSR